MKRIVLLMVVGPAVSAQVPLRGLAYDSLHGRPLAGAFIGVAGMNVNAVSDSLGRFVLPGVPKGTYRVVMQHDVLDAIGISAAGARAVVEREGDSVIVAVPSFATLWRAACGREAPASADSGFIFGTVAQGGQPVPKAVVAASWLDLYKDSTNAVRQKQKLMEFDADSSGNFALCGLPTTTGLSLRASVGTTYGVWIDVPPLDNERIGRRDLALVATSAGQPAVQTTSFTGKVLRDSTSVPVADAEVMLTDLGVSAVTNTRGEFRIDSVPAGTHPVQVRKIGYAFNEKTLDFAPGAPTTSTLVVSRITALDSVTVTARYSPNDEAMRLFEEHRKLGLGKFFTREDLEKNRDMKMVDLLAQLPGTKSRSVQGGLGYILSYRGVKGTSCSPPLQDHPEALAASRPPPGRAALPPPPCTNGCFPHVFLDGVDISPNEVPNINRYSPDELEGIEIYAGAAQVPPEYNRLNRSYCGTIVMHTRRGKLP